MRKDLPSNKVCCFLIFSSPAGSHGDRMIQEAAALPGAATAVYHVLYPIVRPDLIKFATVLQLLSSFSEVFLGKADRYLRSC